MITFTIAISPVRCVVHRYNALMDLAMQRSHYTVMHRIRLIHALHKRGCRELAYIDQQQHHVFIAPILNQLSHH